MNFQKNVIKKISLILVVFVLLLNLAFLTAPKKAYANLPVIDISKITSDIVRWIHDDSKDYLKSALASTAKIAARKLISNISQSTVNWINGGFKGNPAYVSDISKFLSGPGGIADQTVGQWFADQSNLAFLCDPFKLQVSLALQLGVGAGLNNIGCTFTGISRNVNTAVDNSTITFDVNGNPITKNINKLNFTDEGGWDAWLRTTLQPQNNPIGAYQIAKARLDAAITDAKGNKIGELSYGQGALTFKKCTDYYYDALGDQFKQSPEYTEGQSRPIAPTVDNQGEGGVTIQQKCSVKTPGSAITGMLIQKSTTDVRQGELASAFSDGLDSIFSALANAVMKMALDQLNKGVLDSNTASYSSYNSALDNTWLNTINNYNSNLNNLNSNQTVWTNPDSFPTSTVITSQPILFPLGTTTWNYDPALSTTYNYDLTSTSTLVTTGSGYGGYGGYYNSLDGAKNNANNLINSLMKSELAYQNSYLIAQNVLTQAESVFATSSACNMNYNRNDYVLRSLLIRTNVISNIDGIVSSDRTIASIPWNLQVIKAALDNSNGHMVILNKAKTDVATAGTITAVTDSMTQVNSTSFNTDPQATMVENIKTWLRGVRNAYNSLLCPIDLTKVLQITSATSTPK